MLAEITLDLIIELTDASRYEEAERHRRTLKDLTKTYPDESKLLYLFGLGTACIAVGLQRGGRNTDAVALVSEDRELLFSDNFTAWVKKNYGDEKVEWFLISLQDLRDK